MHARRQSCWSPVACFSLPLLVVVLVVAAVGAADAPPAAELHSATLRAGDLTAVIGDNSAHGEHLAGYNGVWSLRHAAGTRSVFVPAYAGLNLEHIITGEGLDETRTFFEPRHAPMELTQISDAEAELHQPPTPTYHVESWTRFRLVAPHYLDMTFRCIPRRDVFPHGYLVLFWASYIHAPSDKSMYFLGGLDGQQNLWTQLCTAWHNDQSTVRHRTDSFQLTFPPGSRETLFKSLSRLRYDEPFFYGRHDDLIWMVLFGTSEGVRFTHSPSGGGTDHVRQTTHPAWDFQLVVPQPVVGESYSLRVRTVLRPECSRDELLDEFRRWQQS